LVRVFPIWARGAEEAWLSKKAKRGLILEKVVSGSLYRFSAGEPQDLDFAVEFCWKEPDIPEKIADICNKGWGFAGRFGDRRYYYKPAGVEASHPSLGSDIEIDRIKNTQNNLVTALLLNIPCTVFCFAYVAIFLFDGFFFTDFTSDNIGYPLFFIWGVFSIVTLIRWFFRLVKRAKLLTPKN